MDKNVTANSPIKKTNWGVGLRGLFLESQVFALYHNGTHLFVGGCFSAPYSQSLYYNSAVLEKLYLQKI